MSTQPKESVTFTKMILLWICILKVYLWLSLFIPSIEIGFPFKKLIIDQSSSFTEKVTTRREVPECTSRVLRSPIWRQRLSPHEDINAHSRPNMTIQITMQQFCSFVAISSCIGLVSFGIGLPASLNTFQLSPSTHIIIVDFFDGQATSPECH
jgi:hypothetical protein